MNENEIGKEILNSAFQVHRELGPGLLERIYEVALCYELTERGLIAERQVPISIYYRQMEFPGAFCADLLVNDLVIVELKARESILPVHQKQLLTYLRLADKRLGFLLNFNASLLRDGIWRVVNGAAELNA